MNASELLPAQFNAATWFVDRNVAEGRGAVPAFRYEDRTLTYADVLELTNRTGNALLEIGVEPENRVLMLCLDSPEFIGTFWGAIKIGAVPIPTNTLMRSADYLYFLNDSRAKVAVVSAPLLAEAGQALAEAKYLKHVLVAGGAPGPYMAYEDRIAKASTKLEAAATSRDDPAYWQYSSGSTGFPKGAVHLQHDMLKVGGIWVSPVEVEGTLIRHDAVLEAAVVGREDTDRLVKPHAYVVLKDPAAAGDRLADELKLFVKDKIAPYKYPRWIEFVTELPKTATGKIQRFKLRA